MGLDSYLFRRLQVGELGIGDMKAKIELKVEVGYWRKFWPLHSSMCEILHTYEGNGEYLISPENLYELKKEIEYEIENRPDEYGDDLTELVKLLDVEIVFWDTEADKGRFWKYYYRAEL